MNARRRYFFVGRTVEPEHRSQIISDDYGFDNRRAAARARAAAVANAVYYATGKRVRQLPIHIEDLLTA